MCCTCTLDCLNVENLKDICLKCEIKILYGIYMIKCDVIDDNNVALMRDVSNIFGDILPILYDFLLQILHILSVNVVSSILV